MKDRALLVNVARGPIVETDALVKELNSGRITAALDVTDPEPLPKDHPLWLAKGVLISPHVGGNTTAFEKRAKRLIESQLQLLASGERLNNIILEKS
jgi:phosphoglycerate dehydrogenase-like enzyme